jgi:integrase
VVPSLDEAVANDERDLDSSVSRTTETFELVCRTTRNAAFGCSGPLRYSNTRKGVWDPARGRAGDDLTDITPHHLRHTCASLMRAAGADVKSIQQQLGHRNATVTLNTYTHLFEGDLSEVMDRLEVHSATESRPERVLGVVVPLPRRGQDPH